MSVWLPGCPCLRSSFCLPAYPPVSVCPSTRLPGCAPISFETTLYHFNFGGTLVENAQQSLPNVHQHDERAHPTANGRCQPFQVPAHHQPQEHRSVRRLGTVGKTLQGNGQGGEMYNAVAVPILCRYCFSQKYRHYRSNRHYSAHSHYLMFPSVPSDFTGTVYGLNRQCRGTFTVRRM